MGEIDELPRPRINTSMLARYMGQPVCFVGRVEKVNPLGTSFVLSDGAGKNTTVELSEPLDEELSGVIEVVGKVTQKATILGVSYIPFREDVGSFDLGLYDEALKIIHEFPQYYPFGLKAE
ncbi:PREDICTED: replication protein A 14 kDa subunit [Nanorana parkeri]|uniref:replication protein A 14 kDa subunit n=1 Tax=Nanorana parkeri TaxID=125878 RepID=UPI00085460A7|nr:PREDICTED: replication protein A 14 kDa subunit [Nanorana parkeri]